MQNKYATRFSPNSIQPMSKLKKFNFHIQNDQSFNTVNRQGDKKDLHTAAGANRQYNEDTFKLKIDGGQIQSAPMTAALPAQREA